MIGIGDELTDYNHVARAFNCCDDLTTGMEINELDILQLEMGLLAISHTLWANIFKLEEFKYYEFRTISYSKIYKIGFQTIIL